MKHLRNHLMSNKPIGVILLTASTVIVLTQFGDPVCEAIEWTE